MTSTRCSMKERNIETFFDTLRMTVSSPLLMECVKETVSRTEVWEHGKDIPVVPGERFSREAEVTVSRKRTLQAAMDSWRNGERTAVLNFASDFTPGGGVLKGSGAQEESLCRSSTLWLSLNTDLCHSRYYGWNRTNEPYLGSTGVIWSPDVMILKTDTSMPERLPERDRIAVDVITCAAPRLSAGEVPELYEKVMTEKIERILKTALLHSTDNLILGAFGCGAFHNPPELVAKLFKKALKPYMNSFRRIEFAIMGFDDDDPNYRAFMREFGR